MKAFRTTGQLLVISALATLPGLLGGCATSSHRISRTWDDRGNLLVEETDRYRDGSVNIRAAYTWDEDGRCKTSHLRRYNESWHRTYFHQEDGGLRVEEQRTFSRGGVWNNVYGYNRYGDLQTESTDHNNDGRPDYRKVNTFDRLGRKVTEEIDREADGTVDHLKVWTYDVFGRLMTERVDKRVTRYTYDEHDNPTSVEVRDQAGRVGRTTYRYVYDNQGRMLERKVDHGPDGVVDLHQVFTLDEQGNRMSMDEDGFFLRGYPADGVVDLWCIYQPPCPPRSKRCRSSCRNLGWRKDRPPKRPRKFFIKK